MHFNYVVHLCTSRSASLDFRKINSTQACCKGSETGIISVYNCMSYETSFKNTPSAHPEDIILECT